MKGLYLILLSFLFGCNLPDMQTGKEVSYYFDQPAQIWEETLPLGNGRIMLNTLAFVIFSIFGVYTLYQGLKLISSSVCRIPVLLILIAVVVVFAGLCAFLFVRRKKKKGKNTGNE